MVFLIASMVFSGAVLACDECLEGILDGYDGLEPGQLDGIAINFNAGSEYVVLTGIDRSAITYDENTKAPVDQLVGVKVNAKAYIPCYIEMRVTGNTGETFIQSFGPEAQEVADHPRNMVFDNEYGGFVDEYWASLGHGRNAEITPESGVYIQACDVFKVDVWANDTYRYQVESTPLANVDADISSPLSADVLNLDMRTCLDNAGVWGPTHTFTDDVTTHINIIENQRAACESLTALHQFRVPYNRSIAHGEYNGAVYFKAFTI